MMTPSHSRNRKGSPRREFEEAVDIAQRQDAGLYLLRSGRDLAQLVADDGDVVSARDILSPIADRITEFRTGPDLQEAAALLSTFARAKA